MNNHATVQSSAPVSAASLLQVSGALIAIIALILAAAWLVKRLGFAPKRTTLFHAQATPLENRKR